MLIRLKSYPRWVNEMYSMKHHRQNYHPKITTYFDSEQHRPISPFAEGTLTYRKKHIWGSHLWSKNSTMLVYFYISYTCNPASCCGVDYAQLTESHSLSMLLVYLRLSPTCNSNYLEHNNHFQIHHSKKIQNYYIPFGRNHHKSESKLHHNYSSWGTRAMYFRHYHNQKV